MDCFLRLRQGAGQVSEPTAWALLEPDLMLLVVVSAAAAFIVIAGFCGEELAETEAQW